MKKILLIGTLLLASGNMNINANDPKTETTTQQCVIIEKNNKHPLEPLLNAIIYVESKGNPKAYNKNGDCVGLLQITKILVRECNNILQRQGSTKRFTYSDRWDKDKSIEMFYVIQEYHNPTYNIDKGIRLWNKRSTYKTLVKSVMQKQKKTK